MKGSWARSFLWLISWIPFVVCGCGRATLQDRLPGTTSPTPRRITGAEALRLYGLDPDGEAAAPEATQTPVFLFPIEVVVQASGQPYDPDEVITELPMYTRPTLNGAGYGSGQAGTWLGDLEAGQVVTLHTFTPDQTACLVEGTTLQGWTATGWVACNRLAIE